MNRIHLPLTPDWLHWPLPWAWLLLLLLAVPLIAWVQHRPRRRMVIRYSDLALVRAAGGDWRRGLRAILPGLKFAALACLIVAAARPQSPNASRRITVEGIAIQMVMDTSGSMHDSDLSTPGQRITRLDAVKDVFRRFVLGDKEGLQGRPNDLIGLVRFARYADAVCPLTLDHQALADIVDDIHIPVDRFGRVLDEANQTAIGDGLALAVERLHDLKRTTGSGDQFVIKSRIAILLTDGENNAGAISPQQAGELAAKFGVKVYTIAVGTGQLLAFGRLPVDDSELRRIAAITGGRHFRAEDRRALAEVYAEIDKLERTRTEEESFVDWSELAWPLLMAAFAGLCLHMALDGTVLRKIP